MPGRRARHHAGKMSDGAGALTMGATREPAEAM